MAIGDKIKVLLANKAMSLNDTEKTQARANIAAAPSGGGVMESGLDVSASSASESYDTFCAKLDEVLATMPRASVKFLHVYPPQYYGLGRDICALCKNSNDYAAVYTIGSYNMDRQGFRMIKRKLHSDDPAGQWDPLEYINPPMLLGVEYRTTERYLGKPVYAKLINLGNLPNNTEVSIQDTSIGMIRHIVDFIGEFTNQSGTPFLIPYGPGYADYGKYGVSITVVSQNSEGTGIEIRVYTTIDYSAFSATALVKYTKVSD